MTERFPSAKAEQAMATDPRVGRLAKLLVQLAAYQLGDREDVEVPVEGIDKIISILPEKEEARAMDLQVRHALIELCGGDEDLALSARDHFLFSFFDERDLWSASDDNK